MSKAIPMMIGSSTILVEVDTDGDLPVPILHDKNGTIDVEGMENVGAGQQISQAFEEVKDVITSMGGELLRIAKEVNSPDKITIEFGVKLTGEVGVPMITKASAESNFTISLEWNK